MLLPRLLRGAEGETLLLTTPPFTLPCPPVLSNEEHQTPVRPRAFAGKPSASSDAFGYAICNLAGEVM